MYDSFGDCVTNTALVKKKKKKNFLWKGEEKGKFIHD